MQDASQNPTDKPIVNPEAITAAVEGKTEAAPAQPVKEDLFSPKFAALAKKEKDVLSKMKAIQEREASIKAAEERLARMSRYEEEVKANPLKALEFFNTDYRSLTDAILASESPEQQIGSLKQELLKLRDEQQSYKQRMEEREAEQARLQHEQTLENFKSDISKFVTDNAEVYEFINMYDASSIVYQTVEDFYEAQGKVLSIKEASDLVEEHLVSEARKVLNSKKLGQPKAPAPSHGDEPVDNGFSSKSRTLSNDVSSPAFVNGMNQADRMRRALAALDSQKK